MKFLHPSFIRVLEALLNHNVDFMLIGGYAVNYYGYGRPTGDLDIWLRPDNSNKLKAIEAFHFLEFNKKDISSIEQQNFEEPLVFFHGEVPLRIDFLTKVNIVNFNEAWIKRNYLTIQKMKIPVVDYEHLILTKISTGRTKDKLDVEELSKVNLKIKNKNILSLLKKFLNK